MKKMSSTAIVLILILLLGWFVIMNYQSEILDFLMEKFYKKDVVVLDGNEYYRNYDFNYVKNTFILIIKMIYIIFFIQF